jgi:RNA polymerase sigma-70 factor (ECF subfamily)
MAKDPKERELAFRIILKTYQERLYSIIKKMVHSHEDTDDILQNTFVKVHKYLPAFQNKSSLYTWIYRIAINETLRFLAQSKAQQRVIASAFEWAKVTDAYEMDLMDEEKTWLLLNEGIERLPPRQKLVFNLRYFEKMTYAEMADILKVTEGSLKASFHHALGKLNEFIKRKAL